MAGQVVSTLDTGNLAFHDAQLDYYGKRLAAATGAPVVPEDGKPLGEGDYTVHIFEITDGQQKPLAQLKGHDGPVWKVAWAHPKFGSVLATCGFDMKVVVWKEVSNQWHKAFVDTSHTASVNDVEFCPWEHGLRLACASSDGTVSVLTYVPAEARWARDSFKAHAGGVQTLTWAPGLQVRLATGGADNAVCLWKCDGEAWAPETPFLYPAHTDWVRAVAWRPDGSSTIASGGWDKTVSICKQEMEGQPWRQTCSLPFGSKVEGVAWSATGSLLAASLDSGETLVFSETYDGRFVEVGRCNESGYEDLAPPPPPAVQAFETPSAQDISQQQPMHNQELQQPSSQSAGWSAEQAAAQQALAAQQAAAQQSVLDSFGGF